MTTSNVSIRTALRDSLTLYKEHPLFLSGITVIVLVLNLFEKQKNPILMIVVALAALIWSYMFFSVSLAVVDGKKDLLTFAVLQKHMPSLKSLFKLVVLGIASGFFAAIGIVLVMLIAQGIIGSKVVMGVAAAVFVLGIYVMTRLSFANLILVDTKESIASVLRISTKVVSHKTFWISFFAMIVMILLMILGDIAFVVGMLVTYPIAMIFHAKVYRLLQANAHTS